MVFNRLLGYFFRSEPNGIATMYPDLDPRKLEQFLTDQDYQRIKSFDNVYILPFASQNGEAEQICFGIGLSWLMIRNLMLLSDVSIHGPEDTPDLPYEAVNDMVRSRLRSSHVTGIANFNSDGYSLQVEFHHPDRSVITTRVHNEDFKMFLLECSHAITHLIGSKSDDLIVNRWNVAQPRDANSLVQLGKIRLDFNREQMIERAQAAQKLLDIDPDFIVAMWEIDEEIPEAKQKFLLGLDRDPYNAQLCFIIFCATWLSKKPQPDALQYCRKAIELSLGHGKAHMCAPHAAYEPQKMLRHSELGYRLLPGNSFAVNNYTIALNRTGSPEEKRILLAEEGISADPHDGGNYDRLIELYIELGDYENALAIAEKLQKLYEPTINKRTLYCLRQNPMMAKLIDSGKYDPAADNRRRIAELRQSIERKK